MERTLSVTVIVDDRKITLEGPEEFVRSEVRRFTASVDHHGAEPSGLKTLTERELIAEKRPRNHSEMVAVLGFCLSENGLSEFSEADIKRAYLRSGARPPKVISQALRDAKNRFDLIESGKKRGTYRLSAHGARTVRFSLPGGHT